MKRISIFLFAAAALWWGGCEESSDTDREIPVSVVVLDASLSGGIVLEAGQTQNIAGKVAFLPENATNTAETYESSDSEIVSVDESGLVAALQQGSAMITVTVGGKHAHFEVAVEAQRVPVERVTLPEDLADGVSLQIGETLGIAGRAIIAPENATAVETTYASSDETVATVGTDGIVTAVALGTATITVTVDGQSVSFELTVTKVPVKSVTLSDNLAGGISLEPNQTLNIAGKATVLPENATYKTETYASSDTDVATVSDAGVVTALKEGTATITVTVDGVEASFQLTVAADVPVALEKIEISKQTATLEWSSGATFDLAPLLTFTPANQNEGIVYTSYDPEIATVDENGTITCLKVGTATITVLAKDDDADGKRYKNKSRRVIFSLAITD
ncbi:MAG: Ig-like domain-containing protein, partial [Alistipes sp.]|nr:Ig-like domain-containing protein [Alistipes sp.]